MIVAKTPKQVFKGYENFPNTFLIFSEPKSSGYESKNFKNISDKIKLKTNPISIEINDAVFDICII